MVRKKIAGVGLALALVIPMTVLLQAPANADTYCSVRSIPQVGVGVINGVKSIYGYGSMSCNGDHYKMTLYVAIFQSPPTDPFQWTRVAQTQLSCYPNKTYCPSSGVLYVTYPFSKCVHNDAYQIKASGWFNLTQGGADIRVTPDYSTFAQAC